ncbi:MAG: AraC family transcriptional regulator [Candidatus Dadabacteria bacterium]|nr:AraC family transcriptional regulator [Candidatus Dadabacteria bacterium]
MDTLSDIIALLRPHAMLSKPITGRGDWGVRYGAYGKPGFGIVLSGQCWLAVEGAAAARLNRGDFVLLPSTPAFSLSSGPGVKCMPAEPSMEAVRHGEQKGEPDFEMLGGSFQLDVVNASLLLHLLPSLIHIRADAGDTGRLTGIINLIIDEYDGDGPGREMVLERLLEVMLVECLRWRGMSDDAVPAGLLSGMRDPALTKVLRAMHSDVRAKWSLTTLAKTAGMSRSSFAARFTASLGCPPMEYLSRWRMTLAQDALIRSGKSLQRLALEIGYDSASAFSTAFRRRIGCSPGQFRSRRERDSTQVDANGS